MIYLTESFNFRYQYSLQFFASLFQQRLAASEKSEDINRRIHIIIQARSGCISTI